MDSYKAVKSDAVVEVEIVIGFWFLDSISKVNSPFPLKLYSSILFLADALIKLKGNAESKQKILGRRPGEKIHEVLVSKNEQHLTYEINPDLYVIVPENIAEKYSIPNEWVRMLEEEFSSNNANQLTFQELEELILN